MSLVANSRYKLTHEPPPFRRAGQRTAQSTTNAPPAPVWAAANAQIVHHLLHLIATVSPGAKRGSTAPFEWAKFMLVEAGDWLKGQYPLTHSLWGKTVGIIGLGRIGKGIAERLAAHKMSVAYFGRNKQDVPYTYYGLVGPARLPADVVRRLNEASAKVAAMPDYRTRLQEAGILPQSSTPQALRQFVEKETAKWREVGKTDKLDPIR